MAWGGYKVNPKQTCDYNMLNIDNIQHVDRLLWNLSNITLISDSFNTCCVCQEVPEAMFVRAQAASNCRVGSSSIDRKDTKLDSKPASIISFRGGLRSWESSFLRRRLKKIKVKVQALLCSVHLYPINSWVSLTLYKHPLRFPHRSHVIPEIDVFLYRQTELVIICEMAKSKGYIWRQYQTDHNHPWTLTGLPDSLGSGTSCSRCSRL